MTRVVLTEGQQKGVDMALALRGFNGEPRVSVLGGYAGTGKTTDLREIVLQLGGTVVVTPTGKAALRVTQATALPCTTIHRWMYKPQEDPETGEIFFTPKDEDEIQRPVSGVVIIDEASMVDEELWREFIQVCSMLRCNILCVGDSFQLPPVAQGDEPFSILSPTFPCTQRVVLTEVMRQALESPIIRASMLIRNGDVSGALKLLPSLAGEDVYSKIDSVVRGGGVALCHQNATRHGINRVVRQLRGHGSEAVAGEPLLVLKNCYEMEPERYNGEVVTFGGWRRVSKEEHLFKDKYQKTEAHSKIGVASIEGSPALMAVQDLDGGMGSIGFTSLRTGMKINFKKAFPGEDERPPLLTANYGYGLTCHKAQGSEWDEVVVYLERSVRPNTVEGQRWLYTSITRAKKDVSVFQG